MRYLFSDETQLKNAKMAAVYLVKSTKLLSKISYFPGFLIASRNAVWNHCLFLRNRMCCFCVILRRIPLYELVKSEFESITFCTEVLIQLCFWVQTISTFADICNRESSLMGNPQRDSSDKGYVLCRSCFVHFLGLLLMGTRLNGPISGLTL